MISVSVELEANNQIAGIVKIASENNGSIKMAIRYHIRYENSARER